MNKKQYILSLVAVLFVLMLIVSSSTFAYFQWRSSDSEKTSVNVTLDISDEGGEGIYMHIENPSSESFGMYPTANCGGAGSVSFVSTVTIDNRTGVLAAPRFKMKVKITDVNNNVITNVKSAMDVANNTNNPYRYYIRYAIAEENGTCTSPLYSGRFNVNVPTIAGSTDWYDSGWVTLTDSNGFPIVTNTTGGGVSFYAPAYTETEHKYKIWFWLDSAYTAVVVGNNTSTDKFQNAKIAVSFSDNSIVHQVR